MAPGRSAGAEGRAVTGFGRPETRLRQAVEGVTHINFSPRELAHSPLTHAVSF